MQDMRERWAMAKPFWGNAKLIINTMDQSQPANNAHNRINYAYNAGYNHYSSATKVKWFWLKLVRLTALDEEHFFQRQWCWNYSKPSTDIYWKQRKLNDNGVLMLITPISICGWGLELVLSQCLTAVARRCLAWKQTMTLLLVAPIRRWKLESYYRGWGRDWE